MVVLGDEVEDQQELKSQVKLHETRAGYDLKSSMYEQEHDKNKYILDPVEESEVTIDIDVDTDDDSADC